MPKDASKESPRKGGKRKTDSGNEVACDELPRTSLKRSTLTVHGGRPHPTPGSPVATPIVQSVNFVTAPGSHDELPYTRHGNTPNAVAVQKRMALLEGSEAALLLASGMGATACTMMALLRPGDHLLASSWLYGGSRQLFEKELQSQGIEVSFVDPTETRGWRRNVRPNTRVLFLESPVNPTTRVLDLRPVSLLARELGLALVVDSTFASPINFRAIEYGADVVIHSATKYLNGHHDVLSGVVCGSTSLIEEVRQKMIVWGQAPDPFAAWLLERGLKTLDVRVARQNESAMRIAQWASQHKAFSRVHYPGLSSHADHAVASETLDGFGGMMAVELSAGSDATNTVLNKLQLFIHAPSLGGVESLVSEPRYTSHEHMSSEQRAAIGIPDGFLRLSVGLEDAADLIADLEQATA